MDINKVKNLYPGVNIDTSIKGSKSFQIRTQTQQIPHEKFAFGKYYNTDIRNCKDIEYICWYYTQVISNQQKLICEDVLESNGYVKYRNHYYSPTAYKPIKENIELAHQLYEQLKSNGFIEVLFKSNLHIGFRGAFYADRCIVIEFENYKELQYNGGGYYVPCMNGKSCRIKNKRFEVYPKSFELDKEGDTLRIKCEKMIIKSIK